MFGAAYLLAFTGGLVGLSTLGHESLTADGERRASRHLVGWTWTMAVLAWLTVLSGTYVVYPWYRAKPPAGADAAALEAYPKAVLLSRSQTAGWHEFGMEWKEHVAWLAPILATAVAAVVTTQRRRLAVDVDVRRAAIVFYTLAFSAATVAGLLGALVNKAAPLR